jgi:hypothetical protein
MNGIYGNNALVDSAPSGLGFGWDVFSTGRCPVLLTTGLSALNPSTRRMVGATLAAALSPPHVRRNPDTIAVRFRAESPVVSSTGQRPVGKERLPINKPQRGGILLSDLIPPFQGYGVRSPLFHRALPCAIDYRAFSPESLRQVYCLRHHHPVETQCIASLRRAMIIIDKN